MLLASRRTLVHFLRPSAALSQKAVHLPQVRGFNKQARDVLAKMESKKKVTKEEEASVDSVDELKSKESTQLQEYDESMKEVSALKRALLVSKTKVDDLDEELAEIELQKQARAKEVLMEIEKGGVSLAQRRENLKSDLALAAREKELLAELDIQTNLQNDMMKEKMSDCVSNFDRYMVVNDWLEATLEHINAQIPKEEFEDIDMSYIPLQLMTQEDVKPKSPAQLRHELNELIKEAKSKIKPVLLSKRDRAKYIKGYDEVKEENGMIVIDTLGHVILDNQNITLEILRKIEDKRYEIDIKWEQTRDLYEKQRVVDQFLEEHQEDYEVLHAYYQNGYGQSKMNKYPADIFINTYNLNTVRFHLLSTGAVTAGLTAMLALINPYLAALTLYDWYLLAGFSTQILNRTAKFMTLSHNKYQLFLNRINFLGFETKKKDQINIRDIRYTGEVKNTWMTFHWAGLPPSLQKALARNQESMKVDEKGDADVNEMEKDGTFQHFLSFMAKDEKYLICVDHENFSRSIITQDLLNHIVHGRQRAILNYDFSVMEEKMEQFHENLDEYMGMMHDQENYLNYETNTMQKKREYQYFHPNRDYGDDLDFLQLKKVDNGEYWNNNYR